MQKCRFEDFYSAHPLEGYCFNKHKVVQTRECATCPCHNCSKRSFSCYHCEFKESVGLVCEESCWVCPNCQAQVPSDCDTCPECGYCEVVEKIQEIEEALKW